MVDISDGSSIYNVFLAFVYFDDSIKLNSIKKC